jgi:hypothetical protein
MYISNTYGALQAMRPGRNRSLAWKLWLLLGLCLVIALITTPFKLLFGRRG